MQPVSQLVDSLLSNILSKQHPYLALINSHWPKLVGEEFEYDTIPLKIISYKKMHQVINVLYIQVKNSAISSTIFFHQSAILERISVFIGFQAIHQIKIIIIPHN